jgi:hypothetical protein
MFSLLYIESSNKRCFIDCFNVQFIKLFDKIVDTLSNGLIIFKRIKRSINLNEHNLANASFIKIKTKYLSTLLTLFSLLLSKNSFMQFIARLLNYQNLWNNIFVHFK